MKTILIIKQKNHSAIVDFHLQKVLAYDTKTRQNLKIKTPNKQIDFIKKVDETFKQRVLKKLQNLTDIVDKFNKQNRSLKKEEEQAEKPKKKRRATEAKSQEFP